MPASGACASLSRGVSVTKSTPRAIVKNASVKPMFQRLSVTMVVTMVV